MRVRGFHPGNMVIGAFVQRLSILSEARMYRRDSAKALHNRGAFQLF
jgi:hypothetical protein